MRNYSETFPAWDQETLMDSESPIEVSMTSPARYQIIVKGKLDGHWANWFNGTITLHEYSIKQSLHTNLTCQVRDQAELLGLLNQLNNLNLPLLQVTLIRDEDFE